MAAELLAHGRQDFNQAHWRLDRLVCRRARPPAVMRRFAEAAPGTVSQLKAGSEALIRFAKQKGIPVGRGRGSAAGSLVSYAMEITDIDPLAYGLLSGKYNEGIPEGSRASHDDLAWVKERITSEGIRKVKALMPIAQQMKLTPAQLAGLTITPPANSAADFTITGVATPKRVCTASAIPAASAAGLRSIKPFGPAHVSQCVFEHVYFARPDSYVFGESVNEVRTEFGRRLARESLVPADVVVPIPDSGVCAAVGFAAVNACVNV